MRKPLLLLLPLILMGLALWMLSESGEQVPGSPGPETNQASEDRGVAGFSAEEKQDSAALGRAELPLADPPPPPKNTTLSGIVVNEAGLPVPDVPLMATGIDVALSLESFIGLSSPTFSGEDGTFLIHRRDSGSQRVRIVLMPRSSSGFRILSEDSLFDWGTDGIRIVVSRPQTRVLSVVEEGTGEPVELFDWRVEPLSQASYEKRQGWGEHVGGRTEMIRLEYGKHRLLVYPHDEDLVPSPPITFEVGAVEGDVRIEMQRRRPLTVRVLHVNGTPVEGTEVELLRNEGRWELRLDSPTGPADVNFTGHSTVSILDSGQTGASGEVVLRGPGEGDLAVKVLGPGHAPELVTGVSLRQGGNALEIEVQTGATVTGTFQPLSLLDSIEAKLSPTQRGRDRNRPGLLLSGESGGSRFPTERDETVAVQADGSFRFSGVPSGNWDVHLSFMQVSGLASGGVMYRRQQRLATVWNLESGETRHVIVDASALVPGRITGQIFLDGKLHTNGQFGLERRELDAQGRLLGSMSHDGMVTDGEGRFSTEIEAGWVSVFVSLGRAGTGVPIKSAETVPVLPNQTSTGAFHLTHTRMRVRFLEHDGSPATERYFSLATEGFNRTISDLRTDADGWLVVDPAPAGPVTFSTWPKRMDGRGAVSLSREQTIQRRITLGPVQVPPGTREAELTLQLPDGGT